MGRRISKELQHKHESSRNSPYVQTFFQKKEQAGNGRWLFLGGKSVSSQDDTDFLF